MRTLFPVLFGSRFDRLIGFCLLLALFFSGSAYSDTAESQDAPAAQLPIEQRPDYILETPDLISIAVTSETLTESDRDKIAGTHQIDRDGYVSLAKFGRVLVQELTAAEAGEAIRYHLAKFFEKDKPEIEVKVVAQNSKEYHVVLLSQDFGSDRMVFPFSHNMTVVKAVQRLNSESLKELAPETSNNILLVRPADKKGKPAEMIPVDFQAAVAASESDESGDTVDIPLKPGDTLLLTQHFRPSDLRPDSVVQSYDKLEMNDLHSDPEQAILTEDRSDPATGIPITPPRPEIAMADRKILRQYSGETVEKEATAPRDASSKYVARSVYFSGDTIPCQQFMYLDPDLETGVLKDLVRLVRDKASISIVVSSGDGENAATGGYWLILAGSEEIVEPLHGVFSKIAEDAAGKTP